MCGGQPADALQGVDIGELVRGGDRQVNDGVVAEFHSVNWTDPLHPLRMWVDERWKYVESQDDSDELYDLVDDPLELHNQIANPDYGTQLERARDALRRWCNATDDTWPHIVQPPPRPATLARPIM